jgi:UDP-2,3-diacylglucosamine hydrolase
MIEAVIFSDVHAGAGDDRIGKRLTAFLSDVCPSARHVYILGDLFEFWFGPKQALLPPYAGILDELRTLARKGVDVAFFQGNRDFYVDRTLADAYGFRLFTDYAIETVCENRVLLCHGDMLCTNDVSYHRMRAVLRHPFMRAVLTRLPVWLALRIARAARRRSARSTSAKSGWVLGIDDGALRRHFAKGADVIVCGHTHDQNVRTIDTPGGGRVLYALGDFGLDGSYLECDNGNFAFRTFPPSR